MLAQSVAGAGQQTAELKAAVELGMRLIRKMAAGNVSTRSETSVIEALEIAVRRLMEMQAEGGTVRSADSGVEVDDADRGGEGPGEGDVAKTGYERFREWASLWPAAGREGAGEEMGTGRGGGKATATTGGFCFAELMTAPSSSLPFAGDGAAPADRMGAVHGAEHSPESARWLSMVDTGGMGVGVDDLGLFGGFPEFGALDGWPGLG